MMQALAQLEAEWLETDRLGGFASGTAAGFRTRRYHALLLTATTPPTGRVVLINGLEAWAETPTGRFALSTQRYAPDVFHPDGQSRIESFSNDPWPKWVFRLDDGTQIEQELFVPHGQSAVAIRWRVLESGSGVVLCARPLMSGRDYHALHRENSAFRFEPEQDANALVWRTYDDLPATVVRANADYEHDPVWYRNFLYSEERDRGLDCVEDLASPGVFRWNLAKSQAVFLCNASLIARDTQHLIPPDADDRDLLAAYDDLRANEQRRRLSLGAGSLDRAAESYIVRRGAGRTIVAGYPWFTDWGRDTFIALRGLCLSRGRLDIARDILLDWADAVSEGMLPNRFPDSSETPEFNSVDASLWYIIAIDDYLQRLHTLNDQRLNGDLEAQLSDTTERLSRAVLRILAGYAEGTRFGIRCDGDGLLACGQPGVQLTWMDAKVGDWVVTPRIGKPVEVEALWLNALAIGSRLDPKWESLYERGLKSFRRKFWNDADHCLYDVVDNNHRSGSVDTSIRPNQIFAVGGLPLVLVDADQARSIVDVVESRLLTPVGLRSLAPGSPGYAPYYKGGVYERDGAYHQGTVWPWLLGPFVEAWVRVQGDSQSTRREARERFVEPLLERLESREGDHVAEIADAEHPHAFRGCPFQAWSVGELIRLLKEVVADKPVPVAFIGETSGIERHPTVVNL